MLVGIVAAGCAPPEPEGGTPPVEVGVAHQATSTPFVGAPCVSDADCGDTGRCGMDDAHESGLCICAPGLSSCGRLCFDFAHDPQNCGGCGVPCADGISCDRVR
jgi:hypothetical protein